MKNIHHTLARYVGLAVFLSFAFVSVTYAKECGIPLCNPLGFDTIQEFISRVLHVLVIVALPIIVLFLVISGFKFITAQGNESKLSDAKRNFVYVILGALLILGAEVMARLIEGTVSELTG